MILPIKTIYFYLHDGLADWEAAYVLPELRNSTFTLKTVAEKASAVRTMAGLRILPDAPFSQVGNEDTALLILPGGNSWLEPTAHAGVMRLLPELHRRGVPIAAICAATLAPARLGLLNNIRHTSNGRDFLKSAGEYRGEALYSNALAVSDGNLITASGVGAVEFAYQILTTLNVYNETKAKQWFELFKNAVSPPNEFWASR